MSLTSCWLEKKQFFGKCCFLGSFSGPVLYLLCPTAAIGDIAPQKQLYMKKADWDAAQTRQFYHTLELGQWRRHF